MLISCHPGGQGGGDVRTATSTSAVPGTVPDELQEGQLLYPGGERVKQGKARSPAGDVCVRESFVINRIAPAWRRGMNYL